MATRYQFGEYALDLRVENDVFAPTSTTRKIAEHMKIAEGSTVLDLGCGSGPLAILAALRGAKEVYAVDIMPEACELTRENAERAGVGDKVTALCGNLFEPVQGMKFDVIIDDVSGMAEKVARISPWFPPAIPTGGADGTDLIVQVLDESKQHLTPDGMLYFPVLSLSRASRIVAAAQAVYVNTVECVATYAIPFCRELSDSVDELVVMQREGVISFKQAGSRLVWDLQIFRAQMPDAVPA